jgi:hypothetical protein
VIGGPDSQFRRVTLFSAKECGGGALFSAGEKENITR